MRVAAQPTRTDDVQPVVADEHVRVSLGTIRPQMAAVVGRDRGHVEDLRAGEVQGLVRAPQVDGAPPAGSSDLVRTVWTDRLEQLRVFFGGPSPDSLAGLRVEACNVLTEMAEVHVTILHAQRSAVDGQFFPMVPEDLLGLWINRQQGLGKTPRMVARIEGVGAPPSTEIPVRGIFGVVAVGDRVPWPAASGHAPACDAIQGLLFAHERVKYAVVQGHPFPERSAGQVHRHGDLVDDLAGGGVQHFARCDVAQVKGRRRCDHGAAIDHDSRREFPLPEHGAVEAVDGDQGIEPRLRALLPGDVAEGHENPPGRRHHVLGRRCVVRLGNELGEVGCGRQAIVRLRVVVGSVIVVGPVVRSIGERLGQDGFAK